MQRREPVKIAKMGRREPEASLMRSLDSLYRQSERETRV